MLTSGLLLYIALFIFREFPSLLKICSCGLPLSLSNSFGLRLSVGEHPFPWFKLLPGWILLLSRWLQSLSALFDPFDNPLEAPSLGERGWPWRCRANCVCFFLSHDSEFGRSKRLAVWSLNDLYEKHEFPSQSNPASPHHPLCSWGQAVRLLWWAAEMPPALSRHTFLPCRAPPRHAPCKCPCAHAAFPRHVFNLLSMEGICDERHVHWRKAWRWWMLGEHWFLSSPGQQEEWKGWKALVTLHLKENLCGHPASSQHKAPVSSANTSISRPFGRKLCTMVTSTSLGQI